MSRWWIVATSCVVACSAHHVESEPAELALLSASVKGGAPSTGDPAVVAIVSRSLRCSAEPLQAFCTGTLIAPSVVLTSAHCLANRRFGELRVVFGGDVTKPRVTHDVDDALVHPEADPSHQRFDVALLHLARASDVKPVPLATAALDETLVSASARIVGFGVDDTMASGQKKTGTVAVSSLGGVGSEELFRYGPGPAMSCSGDSGGPVLFDAGGGETLIGVTRSGDAACTELGTAVRIDAIASAFIAPYLQKTFTPRPAFDRGVDECASTCTTDLECPFALVCLSERERGRHCGLPSLQSGTFGAQCSSDAQCGGATCVSVEEGCRCFARCGTEPLPPQSADGNSGCNVAGARSEPSPAWLLLLALVLGRRRARPSSRTERHPVRF